MKNNIPNVNGQDPSGKTALIWAVINDRAACIPLLVGEGANMDVKDNEGKVRVASERATGARASLRGQSQVPFPLPARAAPHTRPIRHRRPSTGQ